DRFRQATINVLTQQHVAGLSVPRSHFLPDSGVDSQTFWTPVIERLNGNTSGGNTSGKPIGTALIGVAALPGNKSLDPNNLTTVRAGTNLGFVVTVQNSGAVQVTNVQ